MKKSIISIIAAVAMLGALTGCADLTKKNGDISEDAKNWKSQKRSEKVEAYGTSKGAVVLTWGNYKVNWTCWTDKEGRVMPVTGVNTNSPELGGDVTVFNFTDLSKATEYVLYIGMSNWDGKLSNNQTTNDVDFRGAVTVRPGYAVTVDAKNFSEYIKTVGVITITNDEPSTSSVWPDGNYRITEIWPLEATDANKTGVNQKYRVRAAMKFEGLNVEKNQTLKVLFPAGNDVYLGCYQPDRNKKADGTKATCKYTDWSKVPSNVGPDWGVDNLEDYLDANIHSMFAKQVNITRHSTNNNIDSSEITGARFNYKNKTDIIRTKTADGEEIIEEIVEVETGSFEK